MEHITTPPVLEKPSERSPWGAIIGIMLILIVIVGAAYYAFNTRTAHLPVNTTTSS